MQTRSRSKTSKPGSSKKKLDSSGAQQSSSSKKRRQSDPKQYLFDDDRREVLGHVLYEDGTSFEFFSEQQYSEYLGNTTMKGPLFDNGQNYVLWGCKPNPKAENARQIHEQNHGSAVFLFHKDFIEAPSFEEASRIAEEQAALPATVRRCHGGLATVTARKSSGPPAPRKPFNR